MSADALAGRLASYTGSADGMAELTGEPQRMVIVDSLDEARVRVSASSWQEFVTSLIQGASGGENRFLLLGRERILSDLAFALIDAELSFAWYEVSHFDQAQQRRYIDNRCRRNGEIDQSGPYAAARDAVLGALRSAVPAGEADAFVGYAPVLDAVAQLLVRGNHLAIRNEFSSAGEAGERVDVLAQVVRGLLEREQAKLLASLEDLGPAVSEASLFDATEQLEWLAHTHWGGPPPALGACPVEHRNAYAERAQLQLQDHPFGGQQTWTSSVFLAYAGAHHFDSPLASPHLWEIGRSTELLLYFVANARGDDLGMIDEGQFAALHASLLSGESHTAEAFVFLDGASEAPGDVLTGEFDVLMGDDARKRTRFQVVVEVSGEVTIKGPTSFLSLSYPGTVTLAPHAEALGLGPDLFLECGELRFAREAVEVRRRRRAGGGSGEDDEPSVVLDVSGPFMPPPILVGSVPREVLEIRLSPPITTPYPWFQYCVEREPPSQAPSERAERFVRMLLRLARKHGKKELGVFDKKLEGRQSVKGEEFKDALLRLEEMGVVVAAPPMIFLRAPYSENRFDGKDRPGLPRLADKIDLWGPVVAEVEKSLG